MTLKDFFDFVSNHPALLLVFAFGVPIAVILTGILSGGDGAQSPWKYLYSFFIYLVCVPGIFVGMLDVYLFLFERQSIWDMNLYTQALPIFVMIITITIIKRFVSLEYVPGFGRLSGLIVMIAAILMIMWFIEKIHIFVFTYMPFSQVLVIMVICLIAIRYAWSRLAD